MLMYWCEQWCISVSINVTVGGVTTPPRPHRSPLPVPLWLATTLTHCLMGYHTLCQVLRTFCLFYCVQPQKCELKKSFKAIFHQSEIHQVTQEHCCRVFCGLSEWYSKISTPLYCKQYHLIEYSLWAVEYPVQTRSTLWLLVPWQYSEGPWYWLCWEGMFLSSPGTKSTNLHPVLYWGII